MTPEHEEELHLVVSAWRGLNSLTQMHSLRCLFPLYCLLDSVCCTVLLSDNKNIICCCIWFQFIARGKAERHLNACTLKRTDMALRGAEAGTFGWTGQLLVWGNTTGHPIKGDCKRGRPGIDLPASFCYGPDWIREDVRKAWMAQKLLTLKLWKKKCTVPEIYLLCRMWLKIPAL